MAKLMHIINKEGVRVKQNIQAKEKKSPNISQELKQSSLGYYLIIPLLIGVFVGVTIDNKFATKPIFTIIGVFSGAVATFYNLIKVKKITE